MNNPNFKCVQNVSVAYWSPWSPWSDWTKCSKECGDGQKIRQRRRRCVNGVMGEHVNCPNQGHVQLDYESCSVKCGKKNPLSASWSCSKNNILRRLLVKNFDILHVYLIQCPALQFNKGFINRKEIIKRYY